MWSFGLRGWGLHCLALATVSMACALQAASPAVRTAVCPDEGKPALADPYATILQEQKITPDAQGLGRYLRHMMPDESRQKELRRLIDQLGGFDAETRDQATRRLMEMEIVPAGMLRAAAESDLIEQQLRARRVWAARSAGNANSSVAVACFRTIARHKIGGMTPVLLQSVALYCEEFVQAAGREALKVTATEQDIPLLWEAASAGPVESRVAAIMTLAHLLGHEKTTSLKPMLTDRQPRVRLAAAVAMAQLGQRESLKPLVELLSSSDLRVRQISAATLRSLTGRASTYAAWIEPEEQVQAIRDWSQWLAEKGTTARLKNILPARDAELGRTVICLYARNEIIEFDSAGQQTLSIAESGGCPWAAQGLPNGNRIVAMYSTNIIIEYGNDGKERNRFSVPGGPMSVQRLDNGNTLVACNNAQKVVEVDDSGKVVWEVSMPGGPCDAQRLDTGNTLITLQNTNQVIEVDSTGHEVWKLDDLHTPRTAQRLDNGSTLVCDLGSGRIIEYDPSGREVWSQDGFSSPFCAQRLPSGTTLISDTEAVKEIDSTGKVIWETKQPSMGRVWRY